MKSIETRLDAIEQRNLRVEQDKKWETSAARRFTIATLTYCVVSTYLLVIGNDTPFINALVPAVGYLLSTLVLSSIRNIWER